MHGLSHNIPVALHELGWTLSLLGLAGAVYAFRSWRRNRCDPRSADATAWDALRLAIFSYPFFMILCSTALKPKVLGHHFSSLVFPLSLSAAFALCTLYQHARVKGKITAGLLLAVTLCELGDKTLDDHFFWRREDTVAVANQYQSKAFRSFSPPTHPRS